MRTPQYDTFADPSQQPQDGLRSGSEASENRVMGWGLPTPPEASGGQSDGTLTVGDRDPGGRFLTGNRAAVPGSRRGRRNRRTLAGLELLERLEQGGPDLPSAEERLRLLLTDPDPHVRLRIEVWLFTMLHGLPPRRATEADLVASPEWAALKARVLDALEPYPEAIGAVREACETFDPAEPQVIRVEIQRLSGGGREA